MKAYSDYRVYGNLGLDITGVKEYFSPRVFILI